MHLAILVVLLVIGTDVGALSDTPCLKGWTYLVSADKCINVAHDLWVTWEEGRHMCQSQGGDLVTIENDTVNREIDGILQEAFPNKCGLMSLWIGLNDRFDDGRHVWLDKCMNASYAPLSSPGMDSEDCASYVLRCPPYVSAGSWEYLECDESTAIICEMPPRVPSRVNRCPHGWYEWYEFTTLKSTCLKIVNVRNTWQAARSACQKEGGDLVVIESLEKVKYLKDMISWNLGFEYFLFWIGLNDLQREDHFRWLDECVNASYLDILEMDFQEYLDELMTYGEVYPKHSGEDCVVQSSRFESWTWKPCSNQYFSMCERPGLSKVQQDTETLDLQLEELENSVETLLEAEYRYGVPTSCQRFTGEQANRIRPDYAQVTMASINKEIKCDLKTDHGGWIVIQRRINGEESFNRTWLEYRYGFGSPYGDFWLGNEAVYQLTRNNDNYVLRIELRYNRDGTEVDEFVEYEHFRIGSEAQNYRLSVGTDEVTVVNPDTLDLAGLASQDGNDFVTHDHSSETLQSQCERDNFGWWLTSCDSANLNNAWYTAEGRTHLKWATGISGNLVYTEMKIRA